MRYIGFVGHAADKFAPGMEKKVKEFILSKLSPGDIVVSGHCHLGGVDMWAEQVADDFGFEKKIFPPKTKSWEKGYKPRNIQIAKTSDILYVIVVDKYPAFYRGLRFNECYHCGTKEHVKSGGCWTGKVAKLAGKQVEWVVMENVS